ncbi:S1 family peptidase [Desulfosoma caldarium]|uniref:S1 family peptidase n=1 Tax=Desulfosoma caldarium TaxID=610254 RepID=UPI001476703A|nr:serine protease [Desulfosoma caldarium]
MFKNGLQGFLLLALVVGLNKAYGGLSETTAQVRRSVVAVGTYQALRRPPSVFLGTGFVVAQGRHILTNAHVLPKELDKTHREVLAASVGRGPHVQWRELEEVARDSEHDVVLLRMQGGPLPPLTGYVLSSRRSGHRVYRISHRRGARPLPGDPPGDHLRLEPNDDSGQIRTIPDPRSRAEAQEGL